MKDLIDAINRLTQTVDSLVEVTRIAHGVYPEEDLSTPILEDVVTELKGLRVEMGHIEINLRNIQ